VATRAYNFFMTTSGVVTTHEEHAWEKTGYGINQSKLHKSRSFNFSREANVMCLAIEIPCCSVQIAYGFYVWRVQHSMILSRYAALLICSKLLSSASLATILC
jgi:hypothetical protein